MNRWENSLYWARNFSPLLQGGVIRSARFDLTAQQIATGFSHPVILLPGITGYVYAVLNGAATKNPTIPGGTDSPAFTNPRTAIIRYANPSGSSTSFTLDPGFFSAATPFAEAILALPTNRLFAAGDGAASDAGGVGLAYFNQVGDMGAGAPVSIFLNYFIIPVLAQNIGGPSTPLP